MTNSQPISLYSPQDSPVEDTHPGQWAACGVDDRGYPRTGTGHSPAAALVALAAELDPTQPQPLVGFPLQSPEHRALVVADTQAAARARFAEYYGQQPESEWDSQFEVGYVLVTADDDHYEQ